jgi:hypothetical protein
MEIVDFIEAIESTPNTGLRIAVGYGDCDQTEFTVAVAEYDDYADITLLWIPTSALYMELQARDLHALQCMDVVITRDIRVIEALEEKRLISATTRFTPSASPMDICGKKVAGGLPSPWQRLCASYTDINTLCPNL